LTWNEHDANMIEAIELTSYNCVVKVSHS